MFRVCPAKNISLKFAAKQEQLNEKTFSLKISSKKWYKLQIECSFIKSSQSDFFHTGDWSIFDYIIGIWFNLWFSWSPHSIAATAARRFRIVKVISFESLVFFFLVCGSSLRNMSILRLMWLPVFVLLNVKYFQISLEWNQFVMYLCYFLDFMAKCSCKSNWWETNSRTNGSLERW